MHLKISYNRYCVITLDYEVALVNLLCAKFYLFISDNDDFSIKVVNVCDMGIAPSLIELEAIDYVPILGQVANI